MVQPFSSVPPEDIKYFWMPRIPLGCLTLLFGAAGRGKTTVACDILARASVGEPMPVSALRSPIEHSRSIVVGLEDTAERMAAVLENAGGDLNNIGIIPNEDLPDPKLSVIEQIDFLKDECQDWGASILLCDNLGEVTVGAKDTNNESSVRHALRPLDQMAKHLGIAVLLISHPKKGGATWGPIAEAVTGSQAFVNLVRSVLYVDKVPHSDQMGLAAVKNSYYPIEKIATLAYQIKSDVIATHDGMDILGLPHVDWRGQVPYTAQQMATENARIEQERGRKKEGNDAGF
jgi:RecA-family ATPase